MTCKGSDGHFYNIKTEIDENGHTKITPVTSLIWPDQESLNDQLKNVEFREENCIFGDGVKTSVITINDEFPGPTIAVMQGAKVNVKVTSHLYSITTSIHFHGFEKRNGYYWHDGASGITQCGIPPMGSFTYSFIAEEPGLRWYHGHDFADHVNGLYGAFMVHKKGDGQKVYDPTTVILSDILHEGISHSMSEGWMASSWYIGGSGEVTSHYMKNRLYYEDGVEQSAVPFDSIMLNGRAQFIEVTKSEIPASSLSCSGKLHVVCATTDFSVILQVSGNKLRVTEIDGYEIEEIMVDKLMLNPGQTAIVHLEPITLNTENHFWIRVQEGAVSAGKAQWRKDHKPRESRASFKFNNWEERIEGLLGQLPIKNDKIVLGNTPFPMRGEEYLGQEQINGVGAPTVNGYHPSESDENEPNFIRRIINVNFYAGPGFDGYSFKGPDVPFSTSGTPNIVECPEKCEWDPESSVHADCKCTNTIKIPLGSIVEFQLTGYVSRDIDQAYHPVHIHGNSYFVVAQGYGTRNESSDLIIQNEDYACNQKTCITTKRLRDIDYNFKNPIRRNTVQVPVNGYIVIRFRADNPGVWLMHCHMLSHALEGQMLMLDVTDQGVPPLPPNFPTCPMKNAYTATDEMVDIRSIGNAKYNDEEKSFSDKLFASYIFTFFVYVSL